MRRKASTCEMRIEAPGHPPPTGSQPPAAGPLHPPVPPGLPFLSSSKTRANHRLCHPPLLALILHNRHQGKVKIPVSERSQQNRSWGRAGKGGSQPDPPSPPGLGASLCRGGGPLIETGLPVFFLIYSFISKPTTSCRTEMRVKTTLEWEGFGLNSTHTVR